MGFDLGLENSLNFVQRHPFFFFLTFLGGPEMSDMKGCLRAEEPWGSLPEAAALGKERRRRTGLAASQTTLGYVPFLITAFLTGLPVALLLAATQGGLVNWHG